MKKHLINLSEKLNKKLQQIKKDMKFGNIEQVMCKLIEDYKLKVK